MKIKIFTDYACPFCLIQRKMLDEVIADLPAEKESIEIESCYMEIHPETPEGGADAKEILPQDYMDSTNAKLAHYGEPYGLKPSVNGFMSNSKKAQLVRAFIKDREKTIENFKMMNMPLGAFAQYEGKLEEYDKAVYKAYNIDGKDIGSIEVLDDILHSIGIDYTSKEMCMDLKAKEGYEKDRKECMEKAIHITPTLEIDGKLYPGLNKPQKIRDILGESY